MSKSNRSNTAFDFDDQPKTQAKVSMRPYQNDCKASIKKARKDGLSRVLAVLATGLGKTVIFSSLIHDEVRAGGKVLVIAHREELLTQSVDKILMQGSLNIGIEANTQRCDGSEDVVVASVQTIGREGSRRLSGFEPTLIVYDEAHHASADGAIKVIERFGGFDGKAFVVGFTATPHRMDKKPLVGKTVEGRVRPIFEKIIYNYSMRDGIKNNYLSDLKGYIVRTKVDLSAVKSQAGDFAPNELEKAVNISTRNQEAFKRWSEKASDRKTIIFCAGVQHSKDVAAMWTENGVKAFHVDANTPKDIRQDIKSKFERGEIQVLTNTGIYTEGFDVADIGCIMLMRPTQSWALHTQIVGRGTRLADGKNDCIIIDVVDNTKRHDICTLPALMALPPLLDLNGESLLDTTERFEDLSDLRRSLMFSLEEPTVESFETELAEVNLLGLIKLPKEIQKFVTLSWIQLGDDNYEISLGGDRRATISANAIGEWYLTLKEGGVIIKDATIICDLKEAFKKTENAITKFWPDCLSLVKSNARWLKDSVSAKQVSILTRFGVSKDVADGLSKGDASKMIDAIMADSAKSKAYNTVSAHR